ncbi:Uncharacterized BCR%2C YaiI/YqxD family COG1671 [uncultured Ruminococcus sp.]|uniref:UPF0178 protein H8702_05600 n=1 Tax=Massiliimalia timonensis TaxID=1987501 RepID=A0A8J6PAX5_9FIRM|nr:DUF188 domain-containing protein [Massiliimalia timonensis]MBC8610597.1 DUF188 domain-containing protein [Massiliimalia timonensis]MBS7174797.1 DUF188 domain-containing protein [Clostridiales bacterium]SCH90994.1 Uncharacterized BCR%2C YaiI/YqxD family COG1671 [uncultured Clostridium sp.]SCI23883.1 Uncharacterized BCR%2C YaiI/YqxD family COG1671 [uncultured Ruminococcus sp.]
MTIFIDADGCPVVDLTLKIARELEIPVLLICDTSHRFEREGAQTITVSKGADSADFALVNRVVPGDVVVTQDYGLAAMCLAKRALPLNQDGMVYTNENIDALLLFRHTARKIRNAGGRLKGNAKRDRAVQDKAFADALRKILLGA